MSPALRLSLCLTLVAGAALGGLDALNLKPETNSDSSVPASHPPIQRPNKFQAVSQSALTPLALPSASNLDSLLQRYSSLSPRELIKEINRLTKESQGVSGDMALGYLFRKLGTDSPEEARRLLEDADFYCPESSFASIMEGWAETDFQSALSWLQSRKNQKSNARDVYKSLLRDFSLAEPDKALAWTNSLVKQDRELALPLVFETLISGTPRKAKECLALLTKEDQANKTLIRTVIQNAVTADWPAAKSWMESLPGHEKEQSMHYAFQVLGKTDMKKATSEFHQLPDEMKDNMAKGIVSSLYSSSQPSPQKVLNWLTDNMNDRLQSGSIAFNNVKNSEFPTDGIIRLVQDMPAGHTRDGALQGLADRLCREAKENRNPSFVEALDMSMKIDLAPRKNASVKNVLKEWSETAPDSAKTWVKNNASLSPKEKQQYEEFLTQPAGDDN